jgi:hypothetical protein
MCSYNRGFEETATSFTPTNQWPSLYDKYSTRPLALETLSMLYLPENPDAFKYKEFVTVADVD